MENLKTRFVAIHEAHFQKVFRLCMGYASGDQNEAQDLTQEVFIKIWQNLKDFRQEANISTWIYRITVNTCLLKIRKEKKFKRQPLNFDIPVFENNTTPDRKLLLDKMYRCIALLNQKDKAIIIMTLEGLEQKEIAAVMGVSHEALRVKVHRIKKKLIKCTSHE
ncbi:MAG TPA: RNA polymerase sigma factor [Leeuwenhoekiella sp.]|nr:RNA polymerase sigma factor [Leeuwenhoekiella sp.]